jgi:Helix-turn-helix domain
MKRGRPKGRAPRDNRSFGPLGDLIRNQRISRGLGLLDLAKACQCSVQFVSNIEHGRAPLPWEKVPQLASALKLSVEQLEAANLAIRSDFKSFVGSTGAGRKAKAALGLAKNHGKSAEALAKTFHVFKDAQLRQVLQAYQSASPESRKKFMRAAMSLLN